MHDLRHELEAHVTMRVFKITEPVFKTEPLFVADCTYAQMRSYLNRRFRLKIEEDGDQTCGRMFTFGVPPWRVVWVRRSRETVVLTHEIFHLVTRICQDKGIPIIAHHPNGDNGDEPAAYLLEFFLTAAIKARRGPATIRA